MYPPSKSKIYFFFQLQETTTGSVLRFRALATNGVYLAHHDCVSEESAKTDMTTAADVDSYNQQYPNGYELVWRGKLVIPPSGTVEIADGSKFLEVALDNEFRDALLASRECFG